MKEIILKLEELNGKETDMKLFNELINTFYIAVKETEVLEKLNVKCYNCGHVLITWE